MVVNNLGWRVGNQLSFGSLSEMGWGPIITSVCKVEVGKFFLMKEIGFEWQIRGFIG